MKVAYCSSLTYPSKYANRLQTLQNAQALSQLLRTQGGELYLFTDNISEHESVYTGVFINFLAHKSPILAWRQMRACKQFGVKLVFSREEKLIFFMQLYDAFYFRLGVKFVYEAHDIPRNKKIFRYVLRRVEHIFCVTNHLQEDIKALLGSAPPMSVLPNGVNLTFFKSPSDSSLRLGISSQALLVMYLGSVSVHAWKGVDIFLNSLPFIKNSKIEFIIVGVAPGEREVWETRYPDERIHFIERLPHLQSIAYMRSANILVLPNRGNDSASSRYTSPLKLFEYMASGVPIVASDLPSIREILTEKSAFFVEPDSPQALAAGIDQAITDKEKAGQQAQRARIRAEDFSLENRSRSILKVFERVYTKKYMKDTAFYDRISNRYSSVRYPARANTFVQFFFKERLSILTDLIRVWAGGRTGLSLLEIGCADGVVVRAIYEAFPETFSTLHAADISSGMIAFARKSHVDTPIQFFMRQELPKRQYDLVLEVGVLNYTPFEADVAALHSFVMPGGGVVLISLAGKDSMKDKLDPDSGLLHVWPYAKYEEVLQKEFEIVQVKPVGLATPLLWRLPPLGRLVQPWLERAWRATPNLYHEKVYLLSPISK